MAKTTIDLSKYKAPPTITKEEIQEKLAHLASILDQQKKRGILLVPEGAMRWLTGIRHQILDQLPSSPSSVNALVLRRNGGFTITFITNRIEMPRVRDEIPAVFDGVKNVKIAFSESLPMVEDSVLLPGDRIYDTVLGNIIRPLLGGHNGNPYKKISWLAKMTSALLAEGAHQLEIGMNGAQVRGLLFRNFAERNVESNLFLVALKGQEGHFHPLYDARYKVAKNHWIKLVAGARYADMILSATVMVKIGGKISKSEAVAYQALQEGTIEYADCYRNGASEKEIYQEVGKRFARIEKKYGLKGFAKSAYFHHMGGPTSPLGNRDYILSEHGTQTMFPWMQFAINPVEVLHLTKAEVQGIVMPEGAPEVLDASTFTPPDLLSYREVRTEGGAVGKVANLILR